jgi:Arc/MetJ-type ribon-helix-helix transcriptional regulator
MKTKKPKMTMAVVRLPEDYVNLAQRIAKTELRSYSSVLRRAIIEWLEAYQKVGRK